jgi:hypothetical protein
MIMDNNTYRSLALRLVTRIDTCMQQNKPYEVGNALGMLEMIIREIDNIDEKIPQSGHAFSNYIDENNGELS